MQRGGFSVSYIFPGWPPRSCRAALAFPCTVAAVALYHQWLALQVSNPYIFGDTR